MRLFGSQRAALCSEIRLSYINDFQVINIHITCLAFLAKRRYHAPCSRGVAWTCLRAAFDEPVVGGSLRPWQIFYSFLVQKAFEVEENFYKSQTSNWQVQL